MSQPKETLINAKRKSHLFIIIPAFNEADNIGKVLEKIPSKICSLHTSTIVVDDGSTDGTSIVAKKRGATMVVRHKRNKGVGAAVRTGILSALSKNADFFVIMDADGQFLPSEIPKLITPLIYKKADFVVGSRFLLRKSHRIKNMPKIKEIGNKIVSLCVSVLAHKRFTDTQCGFRAFTRDVAKRIRIKSNFTYTQEMILDATYKGFKIIEVPITVKYFKNRKSRVVKNIIVYGLKISFILVNFLSRQILGTDS